MQENRSFDHSYGALRGVRGFRDPRAHTLPNGNPVWFQTDAQGDTYAPFRLDITAHERDVDRRAAALVARSDRRAQRRPLRQLADRQAQTRSAVHARPLCARRTFRSTTRFADAFTVCDQAFCSSLTGTTANRLYLWTGQHPRATRRMSPRVMNDDTVYDTRGELGRRFPSGSKTPACRGGSIRTKSASTPDSSGDAGRLARAASATTRSSGSRSSTSASRRVGARICRSFSPSAPADSGEGARAASTRSHRRRARRSCRQELAGASRRSSQRRRAGAHEIHRRGVERALAASQGAPRKGVHDERRRSRATARSRSSPIRTARPARECRCPSGDVLHQFRQDVVDGHAARRLVARRAGELLRSSERRVVRRVVRVGGARHPDEEPGGLEEDDLHSLLRRERRLLRPRAAVCGAASVAPETGRASAGLDTRPNGRTSTVASSSIGLGYRVPLVIASPWSRGGCGELTGVRPHVGHCSSSRRGWRGKGKQVKETNITDWRRTSAAI